MCVFDTFMSYAGEDVQIASEIVGALKSRGFKVWYAPVNLNVGEKLLEAIDSGRSKARSGILLLSQEYLTKKWTGYEMDTLIRQKIEDDKKIFPIWHNISQEDVKKKSYGLSGVVALNTANGFPQLINKLTEALSNYAPSIGIIPNYESPVIRFLQGRGEILIGKDGPATTIWEYILYAKSSDYPIFLEGTLFGKNDFLLNAAELLPHIPDIVERSVGKEGYIKIWESCIAAGINPKQFE